MGIATLKQNFQDWMTQQRVILFGIRTSPNKYKWLIGPFGNKKRIGQKFINELVIQEKL